MPGVAALKRAPRKGALFLFCLLLCSSLVEAGQCLPFRADESARVSYVYDGDTVRLSDGRKVRLIGINAPETDHADAPAEPQGDVARQALQRLMAGQERIALRYESERKDRYGRLLAHLYLADRSSVQERLLEQGLAAAVAVAPNVANFDCYRAAEARAVGQGIWRQQRFSPHEAESLPRQARGFYIIQGRVARIGESHKSLWLNLPGKVAVRIDRDDLAHFEPAFDPGALRGKKIRVRGWLSQWRGELRMQLSHPAALELLDQ